MNTAERMAKGREGGREREREREGGKEGGKEGGRGREISYHSIQH